MPILYKNNPMPLDGALFVSNPSMRQNNAKDRFIRAATGKSLASIKALKSSDYEAYQDLFEEAGGNSGFSKRKKSKKQRMDKFFSALPQGDTRGKRRGRKSASAAKKTKKRSSSKSKSSSKKLTPWTRFVKKHAGKGLSMAKLADMARKQGVIGKKSKKKNPRRNPLVAGSGAQKAMDTLFRQVRNLEIKMDGQKSAGIIPSSADLNKYNKLMARLRKFEQAAASKDSYSRISDVIKGRRPSVRGASSSSAIGKTTPQVAKSAVSSGKVKAKPIGSSCGVKGAWEEFVKHRQAHKAKTGRSLSTRQYYYKFLPEVIKACVAKGQITKSQGDKFLAAKRKHYNSVRGGSKKVSKVSKSTSTRRTSVAKRKSSKRSAKKPMSLLSAVNRGEVKKSIVNKVKKGSMLKFGEFRSAFKGCGYSAKQIGAKYKRYKKSFGAVAPKKRKVSTKKRKVARASARGKKSASAITLTYVKKLLSKRRPKGQKTIKGFALDNLKADLPKIQKYAARKMREGKSKSAAVNLALTYYRSEASGGRRKGIDLRKTKRKGLMQRYNNPRRRKNAAMVSINSVPVVGPLIGSIQPFARLSDINDQVAGVVSSLFGANAGVAYGSVAQGLKMAEIAGVHYLLGMVLEQPIDKVAAVIDNAIGKDWAAWLSQNAYYSVQGLAALIGMGIGQKLDVFSRGTMTSWGVPAFAIGVAFDVGSALAKRDGAPSVSGVHLNGYGDGGQYMVVNPSTVRLTNRLSNPGYGAVQMNPRAFGAVHANPLHGLSGAEGAMGAGGAQGSPGYGAVLFSGSGY